MGSDGMGEWEVTRVTKHGEGLQAGPCHMLMRLCFTSSGQEAAGPAAWICSSFKLDVQKKGSTGCMVMQPFDYNMQP